MQGGEAWPKASLRLRPQPCTFCVPQETGIQDPGKETHNRFRHYNGPVVTRIKIVTLFEYRVNKASIVLWGHKATGEGCIEDCYDGRQKGLLQLGLLLLTLRLGISK